MNITKNQLKLRNIIRSITKMYDNPWIEVINEIEFDEIYFDKSKCVCGHNIEEIYRLRYKKKVFDIGNTCINQFIENSELHDILIKNYNLIHKNHCEIIKYGKLKGKKFKDGINDKSYCEGLLYIRQREGEVYSGLIDFLDYYILMGRLMAKTQKKKQSIPKKLLVL